LEDNRFQPKAAFQNYMIAAVQFFVAVLHAQHSITIHSALLNCYTALCITVSEKGEISGQPKCDKVGLMRF
jgi:hypothetical protein